MYDEYVEQFDHPPVPPHIKYCFSFKLFRPRNFQDHIDEFSLENLDDKELNINYGMRSKSMPLDALRPYLEILGVKIH